TRREKTQDISEYVFDAFGGAATTLDNFSGGKLDYELGDFGNDIRPDSVYALINGLDKAAALDEEASRVGDYQIDENIDAAYVMGRVDINDLRILGGFRYEQTDLELTGTGLDSTSNLVASNARNDYDHLLPSLHIRYALSDSTLLRAAWSNAVVRPTFEQMSPSFTFTNEGNDKKAELGNPALKAL